MNKRAKKPTKKTVKRKTAAKRVIKPRFEKKYKPGMKPKKPRKTLAKARRAFAKVALKRGGFKSRDTRVTMSSKKHNWRTPEKLLKLIRKVGGPIKLDPCADHREKYQFAKINYSLKGADGKDGLKESWKKRGTTYSNPPYGRGSIIKWIKKAVDEFVNHTLIDVEGKTVEAVALNCKKNEHCFVLVPARPDTIWFQKHVLPYATAICFWRGRLKFSGQDAAPFPSMLIYFGHKPKRFTKIFRRFGWVVRGGGGAA